MFVDCPITIILQNKIKTETNINTNAFERKKESKKEIEKGIKKERKKVSNKEYCSNSMYISRKRSNDKKTEKT